MEELSDNLEQNHLAAKQRVAKNVLALSASRVVTLVLGIAITAWLTRTLEPSFYGILGFGAALVSYFSLLVKFGFDILGARELARRPGDLTYLSGSITTLKLILSVLGYVGFLLAVLLLPKSILFKQILAIQGLLLFGLAISLEWVFVGMERMGTLAVRNIVVSMVHLGSLVIFVHDPSDVLFAAAFSVAAVFVGNLWIYARFRSVAGKLAIQIDLSGWKKLIRPATPIAASSFMVAIYYNLDQLMIGLMMGEADVGFYTAGYKVLAASLIPAQILGQSFFPRLSSVWGNQDLMASSSRGLSKAMANVGLPIMVGGFLLAEPLLLLLAGNAYAAGVPALAILMVNGGFVYINMSLGKPLLAWNLQRSYFYCVGFGALLNLLLNALLIPPFGIEGAAVATLLSEFGVLIGLLIVFMKAVRSFPISLWVRGLCAALIGVGGVIVLLESLGISALVAGLITLITYPVMAILFRTINKSDFSGMLGAIHDKWQG
ncbi:MAG: flippase [Rubricoccaceae bacterium]|nr:flippase [Rubricoccaceae bacterium]